VSNQVAVQRQRDEYTVANLAHLLAPDVSAPNAFDDLSGLSSQSGDDDDARQSREPEDTRLPLASLSISSFAERTTSEAMQLLYNTMKRARPRAREAPFDAPREVPTGAGVGHRLRSFRSGGGNDPSPVTSLGSDQQATFDKIMTKFRRGEQLLEIVHGMPGTGKTVCSLFSRFRGSRVPRFSLALFEKLWASTLFLLSRRLGRPQLFILAA
jgi:hypothetical protein